MEGVTLKKAIIIFVILSISLLSGTCLVEDKLKVPFQSYVPVDIGDGWEIATPDSVGINAEELKNIYKHIHDSDDYWQVRSLLIIKDNKLVAESYMKDPGDRIRHTNIWSCTKQVVGILTGIAIDQDLLSLNDPISKYFTHAPPEKKGITIENLLMMQSGINYANEGFYGDNFQQIFRKKPSSLPGYVLGLEMESKPGTEFFYNDGNAHLVSSILQKVTGKTLRDWAWEVLFNRIGISRLEWHTYKDGTTLGGHGILTTPREMAKLGQLVLNNGIWEDQQIVSSEWIEEMTSPKVILEEVNIEPYKVTSTFGYFWWQSLFEDPVLNDVFMSGSGGQMVIINRYKNLIVVMTAEPNTDGNACNWDAFSIIDQIYKITN